MVIDMMVVVCWTYSNLLLSLLGCLYSFFYIQWGKGYKKANRIGYNMIPIKTLSLPTYFTYIFIYIIIYALESKPWSFRIFWMVGRVIADPSLGLLSPCGMVPQVPILISSHRVLGKWVDAGWSGSSLSVMNLPITQFRNQVLWHEIIECFFTELIE
jgi:hypothetical protein